MTWCRCGDESKQVGSTSREYFTSSFTYAGIALKDPHIVATCTTGVTFLTYFNAYYTFVKTESRTLGSQARPFQCFCCASNPCRIHSGTKALILTLKGSCPSSPA